VLKNRIRNALGTSLFRKWRLYSYLHCHEEIVVQAATLGLLVLGTFANIPESHWGESGIQADTT